LLMVAPSLQKLVEASSGMKAPAPQK